MTHHIGIIGAGDITKKTYLPILSKIKGCDLVAICGRTKYSVNKLAKEYKIKHVYTDFYKILDRSDVDIVFICTPTESHYMIAKAALKKEKNILIEKPLTLNCEENLHLLNLAQKKNKVFYTAFNSFYRDENQWISQKILSGDIGDLQMINLEWYRKISFDQNGGILIHLGAKLLYFALSLLPGRQSFSVVCQNLECSSDSNDNEDRSM